MKNNVIRFPCVKVVWEGCCTPRSEQFVGGRREIKKKRKGRRGEKRKRKEKEEEKGKGINEREG